MSWWMRNNLRMIQNNLREVDADLDVDKLIGKLQELSANTLMMNAGGMFAFYPTQLQYQYTTPYLKKDLLRETINKTQEAGIRFIARFDFSKAHESIFQQQPDWFFRTKEGKEVNYNGIVHTCVNSEYQQSYSLKMIEEVLTNYDVDGIFFNMFGYQTRDYSGNFYGICHCNNCKRRFNEMYSLELPDEADPTNESWAKYREFQWVTTREMLEKIYDFVKSINPNVAISTYNDYKVDIIREESNTQLTRPHPVWLYSTSQNVKTIEDTFDDRIISNCSINAVDLQWRFMGVSEHETKIRLYESIASGSGLDFCIIGVFDGYTDPQNFPVVQEVFSFHEEHEQYFGQFESMADIALIKPTGAQASDRAEYLGIFKMLKEKHQQFDVICQHELVNREEALNRYKLVIIPDIRHWENAQKNVLVALQQQGIHILATGQSFTNKQDHEALRVLFDVEYAGTTTDTHAAYLHVPDKESFKGFDEKHWVFLSESFTYLKQDKSCDVLLPYIPPSSFGPPERAYGHEGSEYYGATISSSAEGRGAFLPWQAGKLYYHHGFEAHKDLLMNVVEQLLDHKLRVQSNAPNSVEVFFNRTPQGDYLVQLLNLSGFNGVTYSQPLPIENIQLDLAFEQLPQDVLSLKSGNENMSWQLDEMNQRVTITVNKLNDYEAIVLKETR